MTKTFVDATNFIIKLVTEEEGETNLAIQLEILKVGKKDSLRNKECQSRSAQTKTRQSFPGIRAHR